MSQEYVHCRINNNVLEVVYAYCVYKNMSVPDFFRECVTEKLNKEIGCDVSHSLSEKGKVIASSLKNRWLVEQLDLKAVAKELRVDRIRLFNAIKNNI